MAQSVGAFKVYLWEEIREMTTEELYRELSRWRSFMSMDVAIGNPNALKGLISKIGELRRENAILRGQLPKEPCEFCNDSGIIPTTKAVAGPNGKDEIVSYSCQPCDVCGAPPVMFSEEG